MNNYFFLRNTKQVYVSAVYKVLEMLSYVLFVTDIGTKKRTDVVDISFNICFFYFIGVLRCIKEYFDLLWWPS